MNVCAYCEKPAEGNYSIHRDGFSVGPEVPLCDACGSDLLPTSGQIWRRIAERRKLARSAARAARSGSAGET